MKKKNEKFSTALAMATLVVIHHYTKKMISIGQGGDGKRFHPHLPKFSRREKGKAISLDDFNPFKA